MKKRQMLFLPQVNSHSFVFFFESGSNGTSWSIRDYSAPYRVSQYGPTHYGWSADEVRAMAQLSLDASAHATTDLEFWHRHTTECNQRFGIAPPQNGSVASAAVQPAASRESGPAKRQQPILHLDRLQALPKWKKEEDRRRILYSPNSEDWVTWNFFQILVEEFPANWFNHLLEAARHRNPELVFPFTAPSKPVMTQWTPVASPQAYEANRRTAMRASDNPEWVARANRPDPVEGNSEIEIALEHHDYLIYIEAKLEHDISPDVKWDPERNQILRNIDCLLEQAGERVPIFWMLVRDLGQKRSYVQLMEAYRRDPGLLAAALPHRDAAALGRIARNLTVLVWRDFTELVCAAGVDAETNAVKRELERRILACQAQ